MVVACAKFVLLQFGGRNLTISRTGLDRSAQKLINGRSTTLPEAAIRKRRSLCNYYETDEYLRWRGIIELGTGREWVRPLTDRFEERSTSIVSSLGDRQLVAERDPPYRADLKFL